jgi:Fe-S cluster assembly scaffold protein SufB
MEKACMIRKHMDEFLRDRGDFSKIFRNGLGRICCHERTFLCDPGGGGAELTIAENARFDIVVLAFDRRRSDIRLNFRLCEGANLRCRIFSENCENSNVAVETWLDGKNSNSDVGNFFRGRESHGQIFSVTQTHGGANSRSSVDAKTILDDDSVFEFHGRINIGVEAENSEARQLNNNILLSAAAKATSHPVLHILNNNVRCNHGATVGPIGEDELFYAMSRGMDLPTCKDLIADGLVLAMLNDARKMAGFPLGNPPEAPGLRAHSFTTRTFHSASNSKASGSLL